MMKIIALLFLFGVFQISNGNPTNDDRIVHGADAKLGQFPHQVLWENTASYDNVFCGGSIYNKSTIITAAHCCVSLTQGHVHLKDQRIIAGKIDRHAPVNGQELSIRSYIIHPYYNGGHHNDICLLTLENDLKFNDNVKAIALNNETIEVGTKCIVSGWGAPREGRPVYSDILQYVELELWSNDQCNKAFEDLVNPVTIDPTTEICAYFNHKDTCTGDGGAPFVCNGTLTGIRSWGIGCARQGLPGVYTNVKTYVDWIKENLVAPTTVAPTTVAPSTVAPTTAAPTTADTTTAGIECFKPMISVLVFLYSLLHMLS